MSWPTVAFAGPGEPDPPSTHEGQDGSDTDGAGVGVKTPTESKGDPSGPGLFRHNPLQKIVTGLAGAATEISRGALVHVAANGFVPGGHQESDSSGSAPGTLGNADVRTRQTVSRPFDTPAPKVLRSVVTPKLVTAAAVPPAPTAQVARSLASPAVTTSVDQIAPVQPRLPDAVAAPARLGLHILTGVLAAALAPFASPSAPGNVPPAPTLIAVLAFVRRELQHDLFNKRPTLVADAATAQGAGDVVTGHVTGIDADGDDLTYTASGGAEGSNVDVDDNGNWTYTAPVGAVGATTYTDSFTITASDGSGHLHGLGGLFSPDGGHTASVNVAVSVDPEAVGATVGPTPPPPGAGGIIEGSLGETGTVDKPLDVEFVDPPKYGTVTFDKVAGTYVYTPYQSVAFKAGLTHVPVTDSFTVKVTPQPQQTFARMAAFSTLAAAAPAGNEISIEGLQITGTQLTPGPEIPVGEGPAGVVMTDRYAYVINSNLNGANSTVTVIDIDSGAVVGDPLPVGKQSILGAAKDDKVYVTNYTGTISVIDTTSNTLVDVDGDPSNGVTPIEVGGFLAQAVADPDPNVHRLYVVSATGGVYVIDTEDNSVVDADITTPAIDGIKVPPEIGTVGALSFSEDGKRLYGSAVKIVSYTQPTDDEPGGYQVEGEVVVIDTDPASPKYNQVIATGLATNTVPSPSAVSGNKLFVLDTPLAGAVVTKGPGGTQTVTYPPGVVHVVDLADGSPTYGKVLYDVPVSSQAVYLTTSPDKSLVYVVSISDGTIAVIDTAADNPVDAVLDTFTYNSNQPGGAYNLIAVSNDGQHLYVSNLATHSVSTYTLA